MRINFGARRKNFSQGNGQQEMSQPTAGIGGRTASQKGFSLVVQKIKAGKEGSAFRLARFYYCNLIIKAQLFGLVYCLEYLKGLASLPNPLYVIP